MSGSYRVERWILTDATTAIGDGLWRARDRPASGPWAETLYFTTDTLVVVRLTRSTGLRRRPPIGLGALFAP